MTRRNETTREQREALDTFVLHYVQAFETAKCCDIMRAAEHAKVIVADALRETDRALQRLRRAGSIEFHLGTWRPVRRRAS